MATVLDTSGFAYALKSLYPGWKLQTAVCQENPAFARMAKEKDFLQKDFKFSVHYRGAVGRSYDFTKAQTNMAPSKGVEFTLTRSHDYSIGRIDTETMLASENDPDALRKATECEADMAMIALGNSLGHSVFGNGSGRIGQVNQASLDTTTLTLLNSEDVVHFEEGQVIVFAADEASALRDTGKTLTVSSVNEDLGTCVLSAKLNTVSGLTTLDSIFVEGDYDSASDRNKVVGFGGWIPTTTEFSTSSVLFGVTRSVHRTRLAGHYHTYSVEGNLTTYEAVQLLATRIKRSGFSADTCYCGTDRFRRFINELDSKVDYCKEVVPIKGAQGEILAEVGFDGIRVHVGGSIIQVFPDRNCPENSIYVLKNDTWFFKSMGDAPRWVVKSMDVAAADQIEFRLAYWGNIGCKMPAANGRYDFA